MNIPEAVTLNHLNPNNTDKKKGEKIGEVENEIPNISGLVTTAVLITKFGEVQKKIPDASILVKKQTVMLKYQKSMGNSSCNKFTSDILDANIKQK